jgi:general secretion pathway protein D
MAGAQPALAEPTAPIAQQQDERWTINMKDADIRDFVEQISLISGQTFVVDPRVKGQVSVISQASLSLSEVYQLFLSVMATHGFSVIPQGDQARIVPNAEAKAEGVQGSLLKGPDALETRVIQVQQHPVAELLPLIRPLVPQYGHLAAVTSANALIISDRAANIARIEEIMRTLDKANQSDYTLYDMRHGWVQDAAEALNNSISRGQSKGLGSAMVIADSRTNRLILMGPAEARAKLLNLVQALDIPSSRSANTRVIRLRYNDAKSLAETLGEIGDTLKASAANAAGEGGGGKPREMLIRADESLNALVILADPDIVGMIEEIVRQLDVPRGQVLVEAAIVEISGDINDALGVQWAIDGRGSGTAGLGGVNFNNAGLSVGTLLGAISNDKVPDKLPSGALVGVGNGHFGALITALSANTKSNLLSTPSLLTLDNQEAEILVGQNVPFQTGSYTTGGDGANNPFTTIERKDIGVTLKVTPHINEGATLRLEIEQEISSLVPAPEGINVSDIITNKRSIKSTILADDGQVIVLGGLIQDDVTKSTAKVPLLGDLPLLGGLFRSKQDSRVKRNLMVFLRPTVVRNSEAMAALSRQKYGDIRVLGGQRDADPSILPSDPMQLFERSRVPAAEIDLRPQAAPAVAEAPVVQTHPVPAEQPVQRAPVQTLVEKPKAVTPESLGNGKGGEEPLQVAMAAPASAPLQASEPDKRYAIQLTEGSSEAFMQALIERNPGQPLRLLRGERDGQPWFRMVYGDFADVKAAQQAAQQLPHQLPQRDVRVISQQ